MATEINAWCPDCKAMTDHQVDEAGGTVCKRCHRVGFAASAAPESMRDRERAFWKRYGEGMGLVVVVFGAIAILAACAWLLR